MNGRLTVSLFVGVLVWIFSFIAFRLLNISPALPMSLACAVFFTLFLTRALASLAEREALKYAELEESIVPPFFYKANGNFHFDGGKVRNGNIYLFEGGFCCISLDKKPYASDIIYLNEIKSIYRSSTRLLFDTHDDRTYCIVSADIKDLSNEMSKVGWVAWEKG